MARTFRGRRFRLVACLDLIVLKVAGFDHFYGSGEAQSSAEAGDSTPYCHWRMVP